MNEKTKENADAKERITILEKGNGIDVSILLFFCCGATIMPIKVLGP